MFSILLSFLIVEFVIVLYFKSTIFFFPKSAVYVLQCFWFSKYLNVNGSVWVITKDNLKSDLDLSRLGYKQIIFYYSGVLMINDEHTVPNQTNSQLTVKCHQNWHKMLLFKSMSNHVVKKHRWV